MAKEFINGRSACNKLGCTKDFFKHLVEIGAIDAERTETGSWKVYRASIENFKQQLNFTNNRDEDNQIQELIEETEFLKGQIEHYKKILREIKRIMPEDI